MEEIGLGFINALKLQGLKDASEQQSDYEYVAEEYVGDKMRIHIEAVPLASHAQTTRANVMNALTELPILLMKDRYHAGVEFYEHYRGAGLFIGFFDNKNDPVSHNLDLLNQTNGSASIASAKKRYLGNQLLQLQQTNTSTTVLTNPGSNEQLEIKFYFVGARISQIGVFYAILHSIFGVGLDDTVEQVEEVELAEANMPAWVFMRLNPDSTYPLANFHILALLEAIARHYSQQVAYREILYDLFVDGAFVSGGCLTNPRPSRYWCKGLRGEDLEGIGIGPFSPYR